MDLPLLRSTRIHYVHEAVKGGRALELTQENVEKLNVGDHPGARLCKGLLLDAIEAGDALEKELSNLRQDYRKISELYISEQNKCWHLEARIKELESIPHTDNTSVIDALQNRIKELEAENERLKRELKQTEAQDQVVIDGLRKENRKTLHALWMARAMMAKANTNLWCVRSSISWSLYSKDYCIEKQAKWLWAYRKCLQKTKEYK